MADKNATAKKNIFVRMKNYFKELFSEIKKITWPTPKQTLHNTLVVIGAMVLVGIFVFLLDTAFSEVVELLAGIGK